jgi:hypothetical protein
MNHRATLIALAAVLILVGVVWADGLPTIDWWVIGGGGSSVSSGSYSLSGTVGQPIMGADLSGTRYLCSGFWCGAMPEYHVYLPLILRSGRL